MTHCPTCERSYSLDSKYCPDCGARLTDAARAQTVCEEETLNAEPVPPTAALPGTSASANGDARAQTQNEIPRKIESHLVKAIISTVCCCLPFGIAAIIFAAQVDSKLRANDYDGALEASKKANLWGNMAIGIGILTQILWIFLYGAFFYNAIADGSFSLSLLSVYTD